MAIDTDFPQLFIGGLALGLVMLIILEAWKGFRNRNKSTG